MFVATKQYGTNFIFVKVERKGFNNAIFRFNLQHFAGASAAEAMHPGHTVTHTSNDTDRFQIAGDIELSDGVAEWRAKGMPLER